MSRLDELVNSCESEKLHLSGAIQPWGALLRVDADDGRVTHASENIGDYLDMPASRLIGMALADIPALTGCRKFPGTNDGDGQTCHGIPTKNSGRLEIRVIRHQGALLFEIEHALDDRPPLDQSSLQRPLLQIPAGDGDLAGYHQSLLDGLWSLTGFDRIMIYRFHDDWSGEVIAERTAPALGSYLNLRFPASDIPAIARNLYLLNPCRHIPFIQEAPVPVLGESAEPIDLTYSDLRSVSPVHLRYLANMGVGASFSIPIRVAGKLWGLIASHHLKPHRVPLARRMASVGLVGTYCLGLSSYLASRRMQIIDRLERRVDGILESIARHENPLDGIEPKGEQIMQALGADGFAMALGDEVVSLGEVPELAALGNVDAWFLARADESMVATEHLAGIFSGQTDVTSVASGMLAVKVHSPRSGAVRFYWFRAEEPYEVAWAGNPDKPMAENAGALTLSPRRSFEKWVERRTGFCRPWSNEDRMIAAKFRNQLLRWL